MAVAEANRSARQTPLRLWPGVAIIVLQLLIRFGLPVVAPDAQLYAILGGLACAVAVFVWWAFFSRAPWLERFGAVALITVALALTPRLLHQSVAEGNMGMQFFLLAIPALSVALVIWAVIFHRLAAQPRRLALVVTILLACGVWTLARSKGLTGDGAAELTWRFSKTAEERLLASASDGRLVPPPTAGLAAKPDLAPPGAGDPVLASPVPTPASPATTAPVWPGFRGQGRAGIVDGLRIETDWAASPPVELWRQPIGPGVSSFAVGGGLVYTQEQRGEDEIVTAYRLSTGEPVWGHRDAARFWDSHVGAGPRATPALHHGRVYALGATGILSALDATDGTLLWSRNAATDTEVQLPTWGFVSSPLVVDDVVVVQAGALAAYDLDTGEPRWQSPARGGSYSSPHLLTLDGVAQILLLRHTGTTSFSPADGTLLWEHPWSGVGIVQPALAPNGDVLVSAIDNAAAPVGTRRLEVARGPGGWTVEERWSSSGLKPSFSPFVVHRGHAYGFDGRFLACIELDEGERLWKGGRFGHGQLLLLTEQDLLLVISERGEVALVRAAPDRFDELARFPAIEGKTWNQPAVAGDTLLVRNGQEMAAFRLPAGRG